MHRSRIFLSILKESSDRSASDLFGWGTASYIDEGRVVDPLGRILCTGAWWEKAEGAALAPVVSSVAL